jgi:hypothetical protein
MPSNASSPPPSPDDLGDQLTFMLDEAAPKGNALPALARLLRRLRDREQQSAKEQLQREG